MCHPSMLACLVCLCVINNGSKDEVAGHVHVPPFHMSGPMGVVVHNPNMCAIVYCKGAEVERNPTFHQYNSN